MEPVIGRKEELEVLRDSFNSAQSEFIAVYGRRRVGKTFLIHHCCTATKGIYFHVTGIRNGSYEEQLKVFTKTVAETFYHGANLKIPEDWFTAFDLLTNPISNLRKDKKVILFFDEFPWMVTRRSRLLQALEYHWNHTWAFEGRIKLIICGSSSSWILKNIINNIGGLYNRVTKRIGLEPFNLAETRALLLSKGIDLSLKRITELFMIMGGIPFYLLQIPKNCSVMQMIDKLFFTKKNSLYNEYNLLLSALFENSEEYDVLLREIAKHRYGVGQADLFKKRAISRGGRSITRLNELEEVGFIQSFLPQGHKEKGKFYKIIDEYVLFYLHWIDPHLKQAARTQFLWQNKAASTQWQVWAGLAFEAICHKHYEQIAKKLEIGAGSTVHTWRFVPLKGDNAQGAQIDLLFDRDDDAITLCEIKYSEQPFVIDKAYADKLQQKIDIFKKVTRTKKQIFLTIISANGVKENIYSKKLVSSIVTLGDLFEK